MIIVLNNKQINIRHRKWKFASSSWRVGASSFAAVLRISFISTPTLFDLVSIPFSYAGPSAHLELSSMLVLIVSYTRTLCTA